MTTDEGKAVLASLRSHDRGWRTEVSPAAYLFFGVPLSMDVSTREVPEDDPPPAIDDRERDLALRVLTNLPSILPTAEHVFRAYLDRKGDSASLQYIHDPHIWISREALEEDGPASWTLVVEFSDAPSYGCHIEFDGTEFQRIWAGD
jgi:hypothetical protein